MSYKLPIHLFLLIQSCLLVTSSQLNAATSGEPRDLLVVRHLENTSDVVVVGQFSQSENPTPLVMTGAGECGGFLNLNFTVAKVYDSASEIETLIGIQVDADTVEFLDWGISRNEAREMKFKFEADQRNSLNNEYAHYQGMYSAGILSEADFSQIRQKYTEMFNSVSVVDGVCTRATSHSSSEPVIFFDQEYVLFLNRTSTGDVESYSMLPGGAGAFTGLNLVEIKMHYEAKLASIPSN